LLDTDPAILFAEATNIIKFENFRGAGFAKGNGLFLCDVLATKSQRHKEFSHRFHGYGFSPRRVEETRRN